MPIQIEVVSQEKFWLNSIFELANKHNKENFTKFLKEQKYF
jgi:hypothetical protein